MNRVSFYDILGKWMQSIIMRYSAIEFNLELWEIFMFVNLIHSELLKFCVILKSLYDSSYWLFLIKFKMLYMRDLVCECNLGLWAIWWMNSVYKYD